MEQLSLYEAMLKCIKNDEYLEIKSKYKLDRDYIAIISNNGVFAIPVDRVLKDGFVSDEVYYPFVPFTQIGEETAKQIKQQNTNRKVN